MYVDSNNLEDTEEPAVELGVMAKEFVKLFA